MITDKEINDISMACIGAIPENLEKIKKQLKEKGYEVEEKKSYLEMARERTATCIAYSEWELKDD